MYACKTAFLSSVAALTALVLALLSTGAMAAESEVLDIAVLRPGPLECMSVRMPSGQTEAVCSTTIRQILGANLIDATQAYVVKRGAPLVPVAAVVLSANLGDVDRRAVGAAFEGTMRCAWDNDTRLVRAGPVYAALTMMSVAGEMQPAVVVMTPATAAQTFGAQIAAGECGGRDRL